MTSDDRDVDELVRLLARKVEAVEADPASATVVVVRDGVQHRLHLPRTVLAEALRQAEQPGGHPFGGDLPPVEACARLVVVHLDESLATREAHESGWWSYDGGFFQPQPPWEAHRRPGA